MNIPKTVLAQKIEKMARLAFDSAAAEGEAINAVTMMVQLTRKNKIGFDDFKILLGVAPGSAPSAPDSSGYIFPFGQYTGKTFDHVFFVNPNYFDWVLKTVTGQAELKKRIVVFLKAKQN